MAISFITNRTLHSNSEYAEQFAKKRSWQCLPGQKGFRSVVGEFALFTVEV
jgi:hypothetical protein